MAGRVRFPTTLLRCSTFLASPYIVTYPSYQPIIHHSSSTLVLTKERSSWFQTSVGPSPLTLVANTLHTSSNVNILPNTIVTSPSAEPYSSRSDNELLNLFVTMVNSSSSLASKSSSSLLSSSSSSGSDKKNTSSMAILSQSSVNISPTLSMRDVLRLYPLLQDIQQIGGIDLPSPSVYVSLFTHTLTNHQSTVSTIFDTLKSIPSSSSIIQDHAAVTFETIMFLFDRIQEYNDIDTKKNTIMGGSTQHSSSTGSGGSSHGGRITTLIPMDTNDDHSYLLPKQDLLKIVYSIGVPLINSMLNFWPYIAIIDITYRLGKVCEHHIENTRHNYPPNQTNQVQTTSAHSLIPLPSMYQSEFVQLWRNISSSLINNADNPIPSYNSTDLYHTLVGLAKLKLFITRLGYNSNEFTIDIFQQGQEQFWSLLKNVPHPHDPINGKDKDTMKKKKSIFTVEMITEIVNALYVSGTLTRTFPKNSSSGGNGNDTVSAKSYEAVLLPHIIQTLKQLKKVPKVSNNNKNNQKEMQQIRKDIHRFLHMGYILLYTRLYRTIFNQESLPATETSFSTGDILHYNNQLIHLWNLAEEKFLVPPSSVQDTLYSFILLKYFYTQRNPSLLSSSEELSNVPEFFFEPLPLSNDRSSSSSHKHPMVRITNKLTKWTIIIPWRPSHQCISLCQYIQQRYSSTMVKENNLLAVLGLSEKHSTSKTLHPQDSNVSTVTNVTKPTVDSSFPTPRNNGTMNNGYWIQQLLSLRK